MFRAEDTSRANYRSLFEYAAGAEARLAQDRRLAYYEQVLPEMLTRVKGLPLMYQTYSKGWNPADNRPEFIVKRLVPDLDKPIYITDDEGNKIQKGFEKQDLVMETDEDIPAFMTRKGRFKGQHGFNKGFSYLAPIYHVERDQMPFVLVDLDIDRADFSKIAWGRLLTAVTKVYDWFRLNGFDPLINFTGSSFHIWAKDGQVRSYAETKLLLEQLSKEVDLPLAAGAAHIKGQVTIDYPQNKYRAPMRFPLSIHGDTGLSSIIIPRNQLRRFDPLEKAHPDQVLKQLPNHLAKIDAWFSDLPQTKQSAESIITAHLDTLNEDDQERCMWGDCGVLADELMLRLQAAGYTDAMYEIGLAYIHPFEEYDDKTFIGGHVVVTVDGESYDVLGAGAKQRWVDGPVVQQMLSSHGYIDLGPLLSSHLTVNWVTSPWNEEHKTRSHNFAGKLVDFESEYTKKRQKPTPEPGVEGGTDLKPSRRKPPMKVKGSDVYSVQKHRATTRGSHRDIRIGLDGKLLSFVPVGRYEKKDDDGKWQKTDGSRLPKKIGEGVSVIRTEDHPFDYWWFEGEIPKDSYGAGPVSLETHGTRRIIEWKPDEKLKVEFIGGKYAGTYTFERSKKSKDGKVWWMRKSRPVPEDKTDKKTKKAEISDNRYGKLNFTRAFSNWNVNSNNRNYSPATRYIENLLEEAQYMQGKIILYRAIRLANPEDFDPTETGESWTPDKNFAEPYFGYKTSNKTYILMALVPVESVDWKESVARALEFGPPSDEKEIVLKRGAGIELINLPMGLSFAIDATPEALIRAAEEDEDWWFTMQTPVGPDEEFGPYDSHEDAMMGIERVMQKIISLQDSHTREFPIPYQGRRGDGFGLRAEIDESNEETFIGTCQNEDLINDIFGSVTHFAQAVDEHGDNFKYGLYVIKYDEGKDIHSFYLREKRGAGFGLMAEDDGGKSEFEQKYLAKVAEYTSSNKWREDVEAMDMIGDETYMYALEGRLEYLFPELEHPLSQAEYDELKAANPELVDEERSIARSISDDMLDRVYNMLFARQGSYENYLISWSKEHEAEYRDGKILLYREITMNNPAELDTARAGIFWTPVLQAAEAHWSGGGDAFLLRALVDFEDINWKSSWYGNLIHPEECEIRLLEGAKIELLPLTRPPSRYGRNRQVGEYVYPEEIVFEIEAPSPNLLAVERGTETELLEAIKDLPEEYRRLMGISEVEPQPTQTGFASEDIDLTVGEAFDKALAEIQADVEAVQPRSKDLSEVTLEDYEKTKQVYQRFMIPAGITGSIVKDEWYYETEPIYLWSGMFTIPWQVLGEEWKLKIDAQRSEKESDILASNEINYAYYWFMILQINSIYNWLLSRLGERKMHTGAYAGPLVELPEIIESQRDATDIEIYRWLATSQDDEPVRRLRNRMRPVDVNYYGGYGDVDRISNRVRKGLQALSYGPCWSLSPDAYTRTDQWRLAQEDVVLKENEKVGISLKRKFMDEEVNTRTYVIEKSIPAADVDWYSTLISSALWLDSPEYEVIPKRGVFLSEEITDSSDFEQEFNKVAAEVTELFKEFSWFSDNQKELYDVSDLHDDAAGRARLRDVELHLARLTRPGSLLWSSGDDSAYDAYPDDLRNPTYVFEDSGIFVDEDGETDGYTDEERGETYEEGDYFTRPFEESPDLDIRLRYAYTINRLSQLAEQYLGRLRSLRTTLKPQFASGEVTLYRAFSLPEGEVPQLRRMTIFPLSMRIGDARRMENREQRLKYNYESYGAHWSLLSGFEWSDDFPSHYGKPYIMEKQIPYTDVDWFTTLLVMAYGREPEWEVAVKENVFLAENEVKISLYHVTPLDQISNILETGLKPLVGPRSERMELEPRVYLFGGLDAVEQALMNWFGDEMQGDEWRSGYAVLRIDLPADWFKQRRVLKTFHPDGAEPSWEWSTREAIPPEYIEVEEEWEWPEDDISRYFQADFGMPVYGKYLRDARNQAELDLATISDDYNYFHLSWDRFVIDKDGKSFTFTPRVPEYPFGWMSGSIEDDFTPRVSLSSTVKGCLDALPDDEDGRWYVYGTKQTDNIVSVRDYFEACPDDYGRSFEMIKWINSLPEEDQLIIKNYDSPWTGRDLSEIDFSEKYAEINVSDLPPKYRDMFYACVPDALQHDEYWSLEPITMDYLGYLTWYTLQPDGTNDWLYFSAPDSNKLEYPLRLYHGTSVRNWRAIQSSGELRTGCLASSHGYDIDMPDTYIDLAIGEIEDGHPDIKAGGVVLEITFPDQATADQYLQADKTMYDLGMAVLEDDLYTSYAPADWQPEESEEGWHYGSMNWFITDFQDLVKSNQATKTIPYYPQDPADWQASYLSVYSVCIKQPIPLKYITVDWGSESRRAEEELSETVGEAWDKALVKWYEIVDWAKHEREKGFRYVSTTELQQAIEVYNILYRVSNKISEPHFLGGSMDATIIEQLIQTYALDDLELQKTLREHYEELHILTIPYVVKSKTMNYFFYYGIIEWIIMMTWRLNSLNSYGGKELDDAISSQFQDSTLKAYRWISVGNDEVPSRNMNFNNYADFSYGAHWSLHPEIYTQTTDWEGVQYQKDYLIEKDVPVEDIDWFETLISCLFFLDTPELEIIMNPMTFIAETIDEPHLYLDMDGCFADFAGAITQRVNDVLQVQDVSSIPSKSLRRAARKAKDLGLTSVSESDFDLSLSHDPVKKKVIDRMLYKIASEPGFFYNLEVMNRDVLDEIIASGRPFSFLSAPIGGTKDYSIEDKRAWVRDRLGLDVAVNVVPREEKVTFCQPEDVLIDDHVTTISEWTAAGGHGVLFPQEIDEFLRKPYNGGTTTYQAEEVEKVKQYPIIYKKNATGTLQQWQVLLLPQESGGYLLTTASGKVGGKITQGRGKLIKEGKVNRTALEQAELQADSKFKKKKDEGYFATKEEAHQNLVLLPMKALDFKKRSHDITYPAVAQRKFDGVRCLAIPQADGSVKLMSRTGKTWTHLHHLQSQIEALNLDSNMVLDGEVYSDTLTFEDATGLVRRQTLKPGDEEKMKQIDYRLYDAILLDNPNATFLDRYSKLAALFPPASSTEGRRMGHLVLTENFPLRNREDLLALHRQFTTDEDFEGVMVRNLHGTYDINKRSKHLQKFKEFQDAEYKIVGYNEASGDWQGTPIWICEMADGRQFNVTPTGDRPSRIEMFNNIEDYMGKLLTVKFFELTADGVPRHGVGLAIRDYE
tara:strand:- start:2829 stop:12416 length:9588 start_codon:yes stop_codon:yes gene_type:complete